MPTHFRKNLGVFHQRINKFSLEGFQVLIPCFIYVETSISLQFNDEEKSFILHDKYTFSTISFRVTALNLGRNINHRWNIIQDEFQIILIKFHLATVLLQIY